MGALTVLGLQILLLACSLGAEGFPEWSVASDTESDAEENNSMFQPPRFETGYGELHQAEAPELGLEMRYQAPQDYDMLMKHRVRRSDKKKKKKKKIINNKAGAFSPLGSIDQTFLDGEKTPASSRTKREEGNVKKLRPKPRPGKMSSLGSTGEDEAPAENQGPE